VSLSPTLGRNEKVEQHIRKKTHQSNVLRFFIRGGVIPLYRFAQFLLLEIFLEFLLRIILASGMTVQVRGYE